MSTKRTYTHYTDEFDQNFMVTYVQLKGTRMSEVNHLLEIVSHDIKDNLIDCDYVYRYENLYVNMGPRCALVTLKKTKKGYKGHMIFCKREGQDVFYDIEL